MPITFPFFLSSSCLVAAGHVLADPLLTLAPVPFNAGLLFLDLLANRYRLDDGNQDAGGFGGPVIHLSANLTHRIADNCWHGFANLLPSSARLLYWTSLTFHFAVLAVSGIDALTASLRLNLCPRNVNRFDSLAGGGGFGQETGRIFSLREKISGIAYLTAHTGCQPEA